MKMHYKIEIKEKFVYFSCKGIYDLDETLNIFNFSLDTAKNRKKKAVLIDFREITGSIPTTMDRYNFGETVANKQKSLSEYIFLAVVGNEPMIDPMKFGETVGINRGANVKAFTNIDEATAYINKKTN